MIRLNVTRVLKGLGVHHPSRFLKEKGYCSTTAHRILNMDFMRLSLADLERLCLLLGCTPNDVLEWVPTKGQEALKTPLQQLRMDDEPFFDELLAQVSYSDQQEVRRMQEERIAQRQSAAEQHTEI
ncbi:helix-turn-helix transcriptional regulator [uncultured Acetobacteroides sp.]|uniref:helix-turn-helix domain-containing protein n=1 Tax=uncultured Acetobacteroides sp. TaxID=1760811 RepID=UPI0029F553C1|nr:helix-turn-helix transcriptional regulator [uncultured Acetobacteroides sp.]